MAEVIDLQLRMKFFPDKVSRELIFESPEMRSALMCLEAGQEITPHSAPLRLLMYCVEGKGEFIVGDEIIQAREKTAIFCDPMVPHGFKASMGERLVVMAVLAAVD